MSQQHTGAECSKDAAMHMHARYGTVQGIAFQGSNCRVMVLNARTANCVRPLPFANCVSLMTPLLLQQSAQQW